MTFLTLDETKLAGTEGALTVKVELGFTASGVGAPFFTLDDPIKGVLDNEIYVLGGGEALVDVTNDVRQFSISRGKSRELDKYRAGRASVEFNNNDRAYDPTYEASPYYGQIVPQRQVVITVNDQVAYTGVVDDWNIDYSLDGTSRAKLSAIDATSNLSNLDLSAFSPSEELSGARVTNALDNVSWPATARSIDTGLETLEAQTDIDSNVMNYLQTVAFSEAGDVFINKLGELEFVDRTNSQIVSDVTFSDTGVGISYEAIQIVYGSEQLHNAVTLTSSASTAVATNDNSIDAFGRRDFQGATFVADSNDLNILAGYYAEKYANPEFRIDSLKVNMNKLFQEQREALLALELGQSVVIQFTPNGIPPQIDLVGKIIGIGYNATPERQSISFKFQTVQAPILILDSSAFGKLDEGVLGF